MAPPARKGINQAHVKFRKSRIADQGNERDRACPSHGDIVIMVRQVSHDCNDFAGCPPFCIRDCGNHYRMVGFGELTDFK